MGGGGWPRHLGALREGRQAGKVLALEQLQAGAAAGRDVGQLVLLAGVGDEGGGVTGWV